MQLIQNNRTLNYFLNNQNLRNIVRHTQSEKYLNALAEKIEGNLYTFRLSNGQIIIDKSLYNNSNYKIKKIVKIRNKHKNFIVPLQQNINLSWNEDNIITISQISEYPLILFWDWIILQRKIIYCPNWDRILFSNLQNLSISIGEEINIFYVYQGEEFKLLTVNNVIDQLSEIDFILQLDFAENILVFWNSNYKYHIYLYRYNCMLRWVNNKLFYFDYEFNTSLSSILPTTQLVFHFSKRDKDILLCFNSPILDQDNTLVDTVFGSALKFEEDEKDEFYFRKLKSLDYKEIPIKKWFIISRNMFSDIGLIYKLACTVFYLLANVSQMIQYSCNLLIKI